MEVDGGGAMEVDGDGAGGAGAGDMVNGDEGRKKKNPPRKAQAVSSVVDEHKTMCKDFDASGVDAAAYRGLQSGLLGSVQATLACVTEKLHFKGGVLTRPRL